MPLMRKIAPLLATVFLAAACGQISEVPGLPKTPVPGVPAGPVATDAAINNALVDLIQNKDKIKIDLTDAANKDGPVSDLLNLGSPIGFRLRNRYTKPGIPLADALAHNQDPAFRLKLIEMARWDRDDETRAAALVAVAQAHDPNDFDIFREALIHLKKGVRFGAFEALTVWGHPDKAILILEAAQDPRNEHEPILRVIAARGLAMLGASNALHHLRVYLDDPSWLVRAMAARYLGDYGTAQDYDDIVSRLGNEQTNDFALAEYCIAALKLFPYKAAVVAAANERLKAEAAAKRRVPPPPAATGTGIPDGMPLLQLDPLVITAERMEVEELRATLDPIINATLARLLAQKREARPDTQAQMDASVPALADLTTLDGYNLKTRYTELGFLLTEGLAGTKDYGLDSELESCARQSSEAVMRASCMAALGYTRDARYETLFQSALLDQNITVRFGALEALLTLGTDATVQNLVGNAARTDKALALKLWAAAGMWKLGDIYGREILLTYYQDQNWFVRAMAAHYLGELGGAAEYRRLMTQLTSEADPMVKAELVGALLKLQKYRDD